MQKKKDKIKDKDDEDTDKDEITEIKKKRACASCHARYWLLEKKICNFLYSINLRKFSIF